MRLITYRDPAGGAERLGLLDGSDVVEIGAAGGPDGMLALIRQGADGLAWLKQAAPKASRRPLASVALLAPIPRPAKNIFCVGKNYHEHAREFHASGFDASATQGGAIPDVPIVFSKAPTTVIGPGGTILGHLDATKSVDYENELAVVIGKGGRGITKAAAFDHVFGYTIVNDVTARTAQHRHKQWFLGKNIDSFCPMGPCIVTADEIVDVGAMHVVTRVNGEVRQDAYVRDLIFDIPTLIETISAATSLEPGDIIATGTPAGVGIGFTPPRYLQHGDIVSVRIDPIGEMSNRVD